MDNAMVKRGIGAVVLAIIAALLLGYLLKDKSRERQEVVEMNLPGTASEKIPNLSDAANNTGSAIADGADNLVENTKNTVTEAGATVIAAAAGAGDVVTSTTEKAVDATKAATEQVTTQVTNTMKPGFSIRPAAPNEQREIVDTNAPSTTGKTQTIDATSNAAPEKKTPQKAANNTVIASSTGSTPKETYKPRLIKERKTRIVSSSKNSVIPEKAATKQKKSTNKKPAENTTNNVASSGSYAIQLMATSSQSRAKKLANTMKSEGYNSYITKTSRNNKVLYRVRISAGGSRNAAIATQKKMKRRYQKNFFVQNSLVVSN